MRLKKMTIEGALQFFGQKLKNELNEGNRQVFRMLLNAYNRYQEDEKDGVDYLFNLQSHEDLEHCVKCGMVASEINQLWVEGCDMNLNETNDIYFFYGYNHKELKVLALTYVQDMLVVYMDEILECMFKYPFAEDYKELWISFIEVVE